MLWEEDSADAGGDDDVLSPNELVGLLTEGWMNERLSPELMTHLGEYADCMMEQVSQMEENLHQLEKSDIRRGIHRFELQRMQFLLNNYLRTRVDKIEMNAVKILEEDDAIGQCLLSVGERKFANEYVNHCNKLLSSVTSKIPTYAGGFKLQDAMLEPDLDTPVFIKVKKESTVMVPDYVEGREEEVVLEENTQHILPYQCVFHLLKNGDIQLI
ncbi:DNA replication complex GINS protein SLD5 isoform X1 [Nilaparvata lugens]|nr:DNA replication complex GINS protein SLD5 isoform X1 [Nilaparvata lugens]